MPDPTGDFGPFADKMRAEGLPELVVRTFRRHYDQLVAGETGMIPEAGIEPIETLPDAEDLDPALAEAGARALPRTVVIKLNGGLGTSMGLTRAKSLLPVKSGLTFLDIIARQAERARIPLVLMNSYSTRDDSLAILERYPDLFGDIPPDFVQHKVPKVRREDLAPASRPDNPALEWCPPGHGDIYPALVTSGMLDALLDGGFRHAFVSNADNLGAVMDPLLLGHFAESGLPFMAEVADRTESDKKGGHLARGRDGQLVLRESAQCPPEDKTRFEDVTRHRYFNTNSQWIDLVALRDLLDAQDGVLGLPLIRNAKTVDPRDADSTPVYQLESAMGAAILVFEGAGAVRVPRSRFAPIKTTDDLLDVRSDDYVLTDDWRVTPNPERALPRAVVSLDPAHYKLVDDFDARFPHGPPSLLACERLEVRGDVRFGRDVRLEGVVRMVNENDAPAEVPDGAVITGEWTG